VVPAALSQTARVKSVRLGEWLLPRPTAGRSRKSKQAGSQESQRSGLRYRGEEFSIATKLNRPGRRNPDSLRQRIGGTPGN